MSRRERQRRRRRNRGYPLRRVFALGTMLLVGALTVGALAVAGWVINVAHSAPQLSSLRANIPGTDSEVFASDGTLLGYIWSPTLRTPVDGDQIPPLVKDATVAIEDRRFWQHGALDYQGIVRAAIKDALSGASLQGASTLTMQVIDNLYLQNLRKQKNLRYKIIQAELAQQLYSQHSKSWILDTYLNDVPYGTVGGQTAYGVQAASDLFFDKPVWKLSLPQAALLAGLPQAPSQYNPFIDRQAALDRRNQVLQAMARSGYITQAQANRAERAHLEVRHDPALNPGARVDPYVFDFVQQQVIQDLCHGRPRHCRALQQGGLRIYTTIDLRKEQIAQAAIDSNYSTRAEQNPQYGVAAAALATVDPQNGHVEAIANSSSYSQTRYDYATEAGRQPGSSFKTFALMTLIHDYHGDPDSTYYTSKFLPAGWLPADPTWSVHTAEDSYQGTINITKATILSDNTVYVQLAADLGWQKIDQTAEAMGITTPLTANPAEVIGGLKYGVNPLEMADAYATLANGGAHVPFTVINRIVFPDGSAENFGSPSHTQVFPYDEAYTATQILHQVITSGTGTAANYGCPEAGKTGTANNLSNAWFVGYTPRMSTAVWVGYAQGNNIPMSDGFGGALAAPIWEYFMSHASGGYCGGWPVPSVPFQGSAFTGPHSARTPVRAPNPGLQYNNPTLFAQPPQSPTPGSQNGASGLPSTGGAPGGGGGHGGGGGGSHKAGGGGSGGGGGGGH